MTDRKSHYDVGYGKPPKNTQFKKGRSGNPNGRPKGGKSLDRIMKKELEEKVAIREGSTSKRITKKEALVKRLVKDAIDGKPAAMRNLLTLAQAADQRDEVTGQGPDLSPAARALVDEVMKQAGKNDPP